MLTDQQGNTLTGATAEAVHHFDRANDAFNVYRGDPAGLLDPHRSHHASDQAGCSLPVIRRVRR